MRYTWVRMLTLLCVGLTVLPASALAAEVPFADPSFQSTWNADEASVPGFWGQPITGGLFEPYAGAAGDIRLVQYFENGRMETANTETSTAPLVLDLYRGEIEIGPFQYEKRPPPATPIAGDAESPNLTYAALVAALPESTDSAPKQVGMAVTTTVSPAGAVSSTAPWLAAGPESIGAYDVGHNILQAFVDYQKRFQGTDALFKLGNAITEPFRTTMTSGDVRHSVIMQPFWQRILIYDLSDGTVRAANSGQAYYAWRYASGSKPQPATGPLPKAPLPDALPGAVTLTGGGLTEAGKSGYASWCQADSNGRVRTTLIADTFDHVAIPVDVIVVLPGEPLVFKYMGADPLRSITATFYPLAAAGPPDEFGLIILPRGDAGVNAPVAQNGNQATITASAPSAEYIVLVSITPDGAYTHMCSAEYQFHVQIL